MAVVGQGRTGDRDSVYGLHGATAEANTGTSGVTAGRPKW